MTRVVVVGASVAGVRTVQGLRREGYPGEIVLIGDEAELPYDKPPLSKAVLAGTSTIDGVRLLTADRACELEVEVQLGMPARHLDIANREVLLADTRTIAYDQVVLATGARARPSPWGTPRGVHVLRSAADCIALATDVSRAQSAVVIGAGFIGSEVAATLSHAGLAVTMVDPLQLPMTGIVGAQVAALLAGVHELHGVATRFGCGVVGVAERGDRLGVVLSDESELVADLAVVGIGAAPNVEWLADSGLAIDNGVICDEYCRAVGQHDVWAAGDVARWWHPRAGLHRRVEHWTNAGEQAAVVAHNIAHPDTVFAHDPVDYVWSDQYDLRIQIAGRTSEDCYAQIVGSPDESRFAALYANDAGQFTGAVTVNWQKAMLTARRLLISDDVAIDRACAAIPGGWSH